MISLMYKPVVFTLLVVALCALHETAGEELSNPANHGGRPHVLVNSIGMKFVLVPAGEFTMGLPDQNHKKVPPAEYPPHRVHVTRPFLVGAYEVTQAEYRKVTGLSPSWRTATGGGASEVTGQDAARYPVEQVSWNDAAEFIRLLSTAPAERSAGRSYRLPTEAEWEYACRAGRKAPHVAAPLPNRDAPATKVRPVGSYGANEFGLFDMRENVWEWCSDWFGVGYYRQSPSEDPQGPATGIVKVVRGRDWIFTQNEDCLLRDPAPAHRGSPTIGFRLVCVKASSPDEKN